MASVGNSFCNPLDGHFDIGQPQIVEIDPPTFGQELANQLQVGLASQRSLESEVFPLACIALNFFQEKTAGRNLFSFRRER